MSCGSTGEDGGAWWYLEVLGRLGVAAARFPGRYLGYSMGFNMIDILFVVTVIVLAIVLLNDDDLGGGRRARVLTHG